MDPKLADERSLLASWDMDLSWNKGPGSAGALIRPRRPALGSIEPVGSNWGSIDSAGTAGGPTLEEIAALARPGEEVAGFRLVSLLGQGAFASVFLAEQVALANRRVVLKVSRARSDEPQRLARLQHTHIVPIHSLHDDPASGLRLLCMPYLGGADLAQVLRKLGTSHATGQSLMDALDRVGRDPGRTRSAPRGSGVESSSGTRPGFGSGPHSVSPTLAHSIWSRCRARMSGRDSCEIGPAPPADESDRARPSRDFFRGASFIEAAVWITARLAEALDHAHSRGLLHRDLKPSNVLIAADGTPMLLDFNLSAETWTPEGGITPRLGGTLPYMAPEHLDAFSGRVGVASGAVDERSDLYSLGLILFEMIAGRLPFDEPPRGLELPEILEPMIASRRKAAPSLRAVNPEVSWGLDAIVRHCLEPDPDRRYARAGDLAEDLRRFLDDRPLKFAGEPSLRERAAKWARRNPRACGSTSITLCATALILILGGVIWMVSDSYEQARALLQRDRFRKDFLSCQLLLNTSSGPLKSLDPGIRKARQALDRYGALTRDDWTAGPAVGRLNPAEQEELREEAAELVLLLTRAHVFRAERSGDEVYREQALTQAVDWLDRAERFDPHPTTALYADRARYRAALGLADQAARDRALQKATAPRSARDFYLLGTSALAEHRLEDAESHLLRSIELESDRFWSWFALGLCHADQGRLIEAAGDFNTCTALAPGFAWPHLNRGQALAHAGRPAEARAAYDRSLALDPHLVDARINRALICLELGDLDQAILDLNRAEAKGRREPLVWAARAEVAARLGHRDQARRIYDDLIDAHPRDSRLRVARGMFLLGEPAADPGGRALAESDLGLALELDPGLARAHLGLALVRRHDDPHSAIDHAGRALAAEPNLSPALSLRALVRARLGDPAALADVERLTTQAPDPHNLYNAACALALLSRSHPDPTPLRDDALHLLRRALDSGFPADPLADDPDLAPLRHLPEFQALAAR